MAGVIPTHAFTYHIVVITSEAVRVEKNVLDHEVINKQETP